MISQLLEQFSLVPALEDQYKIFHLLPINQHNFYVNQLLIL